MRRESWRSLRIPGTAIVVTLTIASVAIAASTHAEYVAQVNPVCKQARHQAKKIRKQVKPTGNRFTDFLLRTQRFGKLLGKTIRRIAAVPPAPGDEIAVRRWIKGLRQQKHLIDRYLRAVGHGNVRAAQFAGRRTAQVAARNQKRAAALGIPACARGATTG